MNAMENKHGLAFLWIILAYLIAGIAAWITIELLPDFELWQQLLLADVVGTLVIYLFSLAFRNASFYDPYWSVIPIALAIYLYAMADPGPNELRAIFVSSLVALWGLRLTYNWARGWSGLEHEDWRYVNLRKKTGPWFFLVNLSGIQLMPTVLVFLGCLPLFPALHDSIVPFNGLDIVATLVTLGAIWMETTADEQLRAFRKSDPAPESILETGLWKYSRHPNYFGEISFWAGLYLFGLAAAPHEWSRGAGLLAMVLLFVFISVPMIDKRMLAKRPLYAQRMHQVSALIPWKNRK